MAELYKHQQQGIAFLCEREGAGLFWEMGTGKSRTALLAAYKLFVVSSKRQIDCLLILAPASVCIAWREELRKLSRESADFHATVLRYDAKKRAFYSDEVLGALNGTQRKHLPVAVVSYGLVQRNEHAKALQSWALDGACCLVCDESSFLKNRTARQSKHAAAIASACKHRWLLTGTPVTQSPLDLWSQAEVMYSGVRGHGPLAAFANYYAFRAAFAETVLRRMGQARFNEVVGYKNLNRLQRRFAPFVSRVEKRDCLDLPAKTYTVREVQLAPETWRVYQELKREAMLALPDTDAKPEPNAAVRILRLCQLTSGHVGNIWMGDDGVDRSDEFLASTPVNYRDVSSEKLDYLVAEIVDGELANESHLIVWVKWRRERERLAEMLKDIAVTQIHGGQSQKEREMHIAEFQRMSPRRVVMLAQQHAGGFGLNLTAAHTAVYLSNDWSYSTRIQSEDRTHRIGQNNPCLYIDVVAVGPKGQRTVDHAVLEALRAKKSLAEQTCAGWRKVLSDAE